MGEEQSRGQNDLSAVCIEEMSRGTFLNPEGRLWGEIVMQERCGMISGLKIEDILCKSPGGWRRSLALTEGKGQEKAIDFPKRRGRHTKSALPQPSQRNGNGELTELYD